MTFAIFEFLQGNGVRHDLLDNIEALGAATGEEPPGRLPLHGWSKVKGLIIKWCDRLDEARAVLGGEHRSTLDRGDEASQPFLLFNFSF